MDYRDAIALSQETGNKYLYSSAIVNYVREEIIVGEIDISELIPRVKDIEQYYTMIDDDLGKKAKYVVDLYQRRQTANTSTKQ